MDPATLASLAGGPAEAASRRNQESGRVLTDRIDKITCHRRFGDSDSVPIAPYDELAPDTLGTPAYRYVLVTAMRNHAADGQSGTDLARHWLASDPEARVPDIAALGWPRRWRKAPPHTATPKTSGGPWRGSPI